MDLVITFTYQYHFLEIPVHQNLFLGLPLYHLIKLCIYTVVYINDLRLPLFETERKGINYLKTHRVQYIELQFCLLSYLGLKLGLSLFTYMINQQMHIYKNVQSRIIILHQNVLVTSATIIRVSYNKNTISI